MSQAHSGTGDNINRDKQETNYNLPNSQLGGGFAGRDNYGNVNNITNNNYINTYKRPSVGTPFHGLSLPSYFVERPEVSIKLKELLLRDEETYKTGTLVISAIYGLGGIGREQVNFVSSLALRLVEWAKHIIFLMVSKVFQALPTLRLRVLVYLFLQN